MGKLRAVMVIVLGVAAPGGFSQNLFEVPERVQSRWISFENPTGAPGQGGQANSGRKGSPFRVIRAGETVTVADVAGSGVIRRIWCTVRGWPDILRGIVIRIYWEGEARPSVEAPLQDFFGVPFARQVAFESYLFSNPEGRSLNCFVPMPFRKRARITFENQAPRDSSPLAFDLNYTLGDRLPERLHHFHARYRRENPTTPKRDFEILPRVVASGRYLGCNIGIRSLGDYRAPVWFGEGEIKVYLDGDRELPTLVGTATEDLVGSAWGLGRFSHLFQGCLMAEKEDGVWGLYRYHIPDPIFFHRDIRVTLQQMAGASVREILERIAPASYPELVDTHRRFDPKEYTETRRWLNFELPQDVCATAYWYQTLPPPDFGPLQPYTDRMEGVAAPTTSKN